MQPPAQQPPRAQMQRYNYLFATFFLLAAAASLFTQQSLIGGALLCAGLAFLIYGPDTRPWAELPRWKRLAALSLIFAGAVCVVIAALSTFGG